MRARTSLAILLLLSAPLPSRPVAAAAERILSIHLNSIDMQNVPAWLKAARVERVINRIQSKLEWDIRKVQSRWYTDAAEFKKQHGLNDDSVLAFTRVSDASVHLGPTVTDSSFDAVFGHELVHVILRQKYKGAVPAWLEEGLANFMSRHGQVDYAWLAKQPARDVYSLAHPFQGVSGSAKYHYQASQALMELIASHCDPEDLLQLSVGKKLESYLPTLCGIQDLNAEFSKWIARKGKAKR